MKRLIFSLIMALMLALPLVGCDSEQNGTDSDTIDTPATEETLPDAEPAEEVE